MLDNVLSRSMLKCFFWDDDNPGQVPFVWTLSTKRGALCSVTGLCTLLCFCFYSHRILEYVLCSFSHPDLVNVFEVFLPQLLLYPNPSDPLNGEAAALMLRDRAAYEQRVKGNESSETQELLRGL